LTKQAVQQLVDDLEKAGIVERIADPDDRRGKIVRFTEKGTIARRDAARVKARIEAEMRAELGDEAFERLYELLRRVAPDRERGGL
ncbi:MAG: MarR family transcriptional regulator, partial [Pseudomonadota bacterium]